MGVSIFLKVEVAIFWKKEKKLLDVAMGFFPLYLIRSLYFSSLINIIYRCIFCLYIALALNSSCIFFLYKLITLDQNSMLMNLVYIHTCMCPVFHQDTTHTSIY